LSATSLDMVLVLGAFDVLLYIRMTMLLAIHHIIVCSAADVTSSRLLTLPCHLLYCIVLVTATRQFRGMQSSL